MDIELNGATIDQYVSFQGTAFKLVGEGSSVVGVH